MKKILYLLFAVAALFSCTTTKKYGDLIRYVNENKASELFYLIDNTTPAQMKRIINRQDASGRTLLHTAVLLESPEIVEKLLSAGADKTIPDNSKKTAVDYAESSRNEKIRLLFGFFKEKPVETQKERPVKPQAAEPKKAAETQVPDPKAAVSADTYSYNVALGHFNSEFLKAVKEQDYAAVNELLNKRKNVNETDMNGNNALFYTLVSSNGAIMNLLLSHGINPNHGNKAGQLPFLYAVNKGNIASIQALLDAGANINQTDTSGISAVMIAVFNHNAGLLKFLHVKGAYLNSKDSYGNTLLHIAIKNEDPAITRYLLENGCDVYEPNDMGIKPISLLKSSKRTDFRNMAKKYEE